MKKIAILGGGMSALAAAHSLSSGPNWKSAYDITVYQLGWRLGGKTATGRGPNNRIEEHGIHILQGWYETTFKLLRSVYAERKAKGLDPNSPLQDLFADGLQRNNTTLLTSFDQVEGKWVNWPMIFPSLTELPGEGTPLTVEEEITKGIELLIEVLTGHLPKLPFGPIIQALIDELAKIVGTGGSGITWLEHHQAVTRLLEKLFNIVVVELEKIGRPDPTVHHFTLILAFSYYTLLGILNDVYDSKTDKLDFTRIDHLDFREWIASQGAPELVTKSVMVQFFYTGTFSNLYNDTGGAISAGVALLFLLASVGYKGSFVFQFVYGTGDTMVMPLYQVLKARGIKFKFFQDVQRLYQIESGDVERIDVMEQVKLTVSDYDPTITVNNLMCWPSVPNYNQIDPSQAAQLKAGDIDLEDPWTSWPGYKPITLQKGVDFDDIILGIPLGMLPTVCSEIIQARKPWQDMINNVKTTPTLSAQLWYLKTSEEMGFDKALWGLPPTDSAPNVVTYQNPWYSWLDSSLALKSETWLPNQLPKFLAYYTGVLTINKPLPPFSDHDYPKEQLKRVKEIFLQWLNDNSGWFWPKATSLPYPTGLDLNILAFDAAANSGYERFDNQFFRANVRPSDHYTLNIPGSNRHRLKANESGLNNLWLCGDWIDFGINIGYIDGAIMSGQQAAIAIANSEQQQ
ncbi:MAG: NAD(P)-binding protein [Ignavibacteria bacterium]|nr:NAD(P)-binding protein [Ignavibacteria bacterium]